MLRGRRSECEVLDGLVDGARVGRSGALVMRGEPGVGKTALLQYAIDSASDLRVLRAVGVESEMELAFAALQQFCAPILDQLDQLPAPQRDALGTAFGLTAGRAPDRYLVGLAVLGLLSEVAEERLLLCVVDDAQWVDRASTDALTFVARRLGAESVAMVFAMREPDNTFTGLPELVVEGLRDSDARELLRSVVRWPLDERVRERIVAETRGNPLALLELPHGLSPAQLAGGFGPLTALPLSGRIEESFRRRLGDLPEQTRLLLLIAAAEPLGDPALLWRASGQLGITHEALASAETAGLLEVGLAIRFRHPLVRSAAYRSASVLERQRVHRALAEATDPELDPDRRAWHLAQATPGADEEVAEKLAQSAGRAQARGGLAAAAAFLERAVGLTPDPARRAQRALAAAEAKHLAGAAEVALRLLNTAVAEPLDELGRARADLLRARVEFVGNRGRDAPSLFVAAAERLKPLDAGLARDAYLQGLGTATYVGQRASGGSVLEIAQAALAAPSAQAPPRPSDLLLDGLAMRFTAGYAAGAPPLRLALDAFQRDDVSSEDELRWLWLAWRAAVDLWEDDRWEALATRHVQLARETGALNVLPAALDIRIIAHVCTGELAAGVSLLEEMHAITEAIGTNVSRYASAGWLAGPLVLAAWRGREAETQDVIERMVKEAVPGSEGLWLTVIQWARAKLYNALGRYEDAAAAAERATEYPEDLVFFNWGLVELVIAAARSENPQRAAAALERLSEMTRASGTDWALGIEARSQALLSERDTAECLYLESIERLGRTRVRPELAHAHLLYGEWLRRERRRLDAREQLRTAHEMFATMGYEAFAGRAEQELLATGERARKRSVETREELTAQEAQVARLARDGLSNAEIGERLFISTKTVEYHLHKVFTKLGISSRRQLVAALPAESSAGLVV
ncbi:MAG: LuxR C-terminal-related transcriptional regulator [Solirubrobacteraceae bacterium]